MNRWAEKFGSPLTRIGLGIAALGTTAIGLAPAAGATFDLEKAFAATVAIVAWLFSELKSASSSPKKLHAKLSPHDADLGERLRSIATDDFIRFLDEHDFGGSFRDSEASRIHDLADFTRNASSEFDDSEIQSAWLIASEESVRLSKLVA